MATRSWNRVELIGNLTRDPELRYTPSGTAVATFTVATNRTYMSDGEKKEEADFHKAVAWGKLAELCSQLLKKGYRVFISGRLQNRSWEAQDGQTRNVTEIVVEDMILLTSTPREGVSTETIPEPVKEPEQDTVPVEINQALGGEETQETQDVVTNAAVGSDAGADKPKDDKKPSGDLDDLPF